MTIPLAAEFEEHFVRGAPPEADLGWKHRHLFLSCIR